MNNMGGKIGVGGGMRLEKDEEKNRETREWFPGRFTASGHEVTIQIAILLHPPFSEG